MSNVVLAIVLLGGCFLMHFWMMRKGGHGSCHTDASEKKKSEDNHAGHSCH